MVLRVASCSILLSTRNHDTVIYWLFIQKLFQAFSLSHYGTGKYYLKRC